MSYLQKLVIKESVHTISLPPHSTYLQVNFMLRVYIAVYRGKFHHHVDRQVSSLRSTYTQAKSGDTKVVSFLATYTQSKSGDTHVKHKLKPFV